MNISILSEGGRIYGFGHITRCLSISEGFKKYNIFPKFIINGDSSLDKLLDNTQHVKFNWELNRERLFQELYNCNILIIDSIEISDDLLHKISALNIFIVMIDDYNRKGLLKKGIIIDWTILAEKKNFHNINQNITYLLGSKYTPLRKEFNIDFQREANKEIKHILISFGGSDVRNMSPKILSFLNYEFVNIKKTIIVGSGFSNIDQIHKASDQNTNIIIDANAKEMSRQIQNADIAIASGGQTLYELARLNLPTISVTLVKNQLNDIMGWEETSSFYNAGWYDDNNLLANIKKYIEILQNREQREKIIKKTQLYLSDNGTDVLVNEILKGYNNDII